MSWWKRLFGERASVSEKVPSPPAVKPQADKVPQPPREAQPPRSSVDVRTLIAPLANGDKATLSTLRAESWRLLPDVLSFMHRQLAELCAKAGPLLDDEVLREVTTASDRHFAAMKAMGEPAIQALFGVLSHSNADARGGACQALSILGADHTIPKDVMEALAHLATEGMVTDRAASVNSLRELAKTQDFAPLLSAVTLLLISEDARIRWDAAQMISNSEVAVTNQECVNALAALLTDTRKDVLQAGRDAFGGSYQPLAPDIPEFLRQVVQGQPNPATPQPTAHSTPVRMGDGGLVGVIGGGDLRNLAKDVPVSAGIVDMRSEKDKSIEKDAKLGASLGSETDALIWELIDIGQNDEFLSDEPGGKFDAECRHVRARQIGERLNEVGGIDLMQLAYHRVRNALGGGPARLLESAWGYIGSWMP
jgi:hypothetical protein